jgi:hypothetical protein
MKEILQRAIGELGMFPEDINNGYCDAFAALVAEELTACDMFCADYDCDCDSDDRTRAHVWIRYEGKHYDAECLEGVESFLDLPIFRDRKIVILKLVCNGEVLQWGKCPYSIW